MKNLLFPLATIFFLSSQILIAQTSSTSFYGSVHFCVSEQSSQQLNLKL